MPRRDSRGLATLARVLTRIAAPPQAAVRVVREHAEPGPGFLALRRVDITVELEGRSSAAVTYDWVERRHPDAVVIAAHFERGGARHVLLRSCVRPPLALRGGVAAGNLWELPAGLIEAGEDPRDAAARELHEEIGAAVDPAALEPLGPFTLPAAGVLAERNHFFHVVVDPAALVTPAGDLTPLEEGGRVLAVPLADALRAARAGALPDAKTEIGLRRLAELP